MTEPVELRHLSRDEIRWNMDEQWPSFKIQWGDEQYGGHMFKVDPFPAYPHDEQLAWELLQRTVAVWKPSIPVALWISEVEAIDRANAFATYTTRYEYDEDGKKEADLRRGHIVLHAKRTPPHPAMTAALIGHEYGHIVQYMLEQSDDNYGEVIAEYAAIRGLDTTPDGRRATGGRWHASPTEVFASDFRVAMRRIQPEFWPHPGVTHPDDDPEVARWWSEQFNKWNAKT